MKPLNPSKFRRYITFQSPAYTTDAAGENVISSWNDEFDRWSAIETLSGKEFLAAFHQVTANQGQKITLWYSPDISPDWRIQYGSRIFKIVSIAHDEDSLRQTEIMATETK